MLLRRTPPLHTVRLARPRLVRAAAWALGLALPWAGAPAIAHAQAAAPLFADSPALDSLRWMQTLGRVPLHQWSLRPFGAAEPRELTGPPADSAARALSWSVLPARVRTYLNSSFPYGYNDGAVWQGRGLTSALDAGFAAHAGPLTVVLAPTAFVAQNVAFTLMPNGQTGATRFGDPQYPTLVDLPQRFGNGTYARLDPGQSTVRLDAFGVGAGFSTANEWWGPMTTFPYVLGDNAPGIPRLFLGTSKPVDAYVARVHGEVFWGRTRESAYADIPDSVRNPMVIGLELVVEPRLLDGLEVGVARLFRAPWPPAPLSWYTLRKPFEGLLGNQVKSTGTTPLGYNDDQEFSVFARWVLPRSGFEAYSEFGRTDRNGDVRDLLQEPDHTASLGLGLRKAWRRRDGGLWGLGAESINYQISTLERQRPQPGAYIHTRMRQGATNAGQLLGAGIAAGSAAGSVVWLERMAGSGTWRVSWVRMLRHQRGTYQRIDPAPDLKGVDVSHALGVERRWTAGAVTFAAEVTGVYELNRDWRTDAGNVHASVSAVWRP